MAQMTVTLAHVPMFWLAPWTMLLRSACRWLSPEAQTATAPAPFAPRWPRPLGLQRWVGQAIDARLAWMREHPEAACYRPSGPAALGSQARGTRSRPRSLLP